MWQEWKEDQKFNFLRWLVKEEESELNTYIKYLLDLFQ